MKKLILVLMVLIFAGSAQAANILTNPGFDDAPPLTGWTAWRNGGATAGVNTVDYLSTPQSCELYSPKANWDSGGGVYQEFDVGTNGITVGGAVSFEGNCKATGTPYSVLKIIYLDSGGGTISFNEIPLAVGGPIDWTYAKAIGLVPTGCAKVKFELVCWEIGTALFDDVSAEAFDFDPWDPCDPNNRLLNHNFEEASQSGERMVPYFWNIYTLSDVGEYDHNQVADVTAVDGNDIWILSDSNTCPDEEGIIGHQVLDAEGLYDTNSYSFSVYLRNPNTVVPATVKIGFDYYETSGYQDVIGEDVDEVTVPADNTWYKYSHSALKWLNSGKMGVKVKVHGAIIHVDDAVLHDLGVDMCGLAGREATDQLGYFPRLPGDLNGDCKVDFEDMEAVVEDWLESVIIP